MTGWRVIPDTDDLYLINSSGEVFSNISNKTLRHNNRNGYRSVRISVRGEVRTLSVHRLVLTVFTGDYPGMQVNHKDGDKTNNDISNLEWVSAKDNIKHAIETGLRGPQKLKLSSEEVRQVHTFIDHGGFTYTELGSMFGVNRNTIYHINVRRRGG